LIADVPLSDIKANRFNSRSNYSKGCIDRMALSMSLHGQMSPVKVRLSKTGEKYELVFGHRRVFAAKQLGWEKIKADLAELSDEQSILQSIVENIDRDDLSDFEKALIFEKLHLEFGKNYQEIGEMIGLSKQSISNYIGMLRLFDSAYLADNPELQQMMYQLSERHARTIMRVPDHKDRENLVRMTLNEDLSVRHLNSVLLRLRSWFNDEDLNERYSYEAIGNEFNGTSVKEITRLINEKFLLSEIGDLANSDRIYLFGGGYTLFSSMKKDLLENKDAESYKHNWSLRVARAFKWKIEKLRITVLSPTSAMATAIVRYSNKSAHFGIRGTVIVVLKQDGWKIVHEHWSKFESSDSKLENELILGDKKFRRQIRHSTEKGRLTQRSVFRISNSVTA
jgi:ParB family chromosome partitioning protein